MEQLTEEQLTYIKSVEEHVSALGLTTVARQIAEGTYDVPDDNLMKFNLPTSQSGFDTGNGEGVWGVPYTEADQKIYDNSDNTRGVLFQVVLLNDAISYPFPYGTVLTVETRATNRPVINYKWLDEKVAGTGEGATLADLLED